MGQLWELLSCFVLTERKGKARLGLLVMDFVNESLLDIYLALFCNYLRFQSSLSSILSVLIGETYGCSSG